jgi:hypothetical protein
MPISPNTTIINTWEVAEPLDKPKEGPRIAAVLANLANQSQGLDISQLFMSGRLERILGVYIDNSANANTFELSINEIGYNIIVQANWQGWFRFPTPINFAKLSFSSTGTGIIPLFFVNFNIDSYSWGTTVALGAPMIVGQASPNVSTSNTAETLLASVTIPAGIMGANGRIEIITSWNWTNNADNKTVKIKFGTVVGGFAGATEFSGFVLTVNTNIQSLTNIYNNNATNLQIGGTGTGGNAYVVNSGTAPTSAIDTTQNTMIYFTGQLTLGTDVLTLQSYSVIVYPHS